MKLHPLAWIPTLYTAEGIPNVIVCSVALYMFQRVGLSNAETAFFVAWLYLPWVIKPFWSPIVDMIGSKRLWILLMQILIGGALAGVALSLPGGHILTYGMAFLWIIAFSSATHDIAADGFYMLELHPHEQALYVGVRSTFYRIAGILGQGVLVMLAGVLEARTGNPLQAWSLTFGSAAALFLLLATAHAFLLPHPVSDQMHRLRLDTLRRTVADMGGTVVSFVKKRQFLLAVTFMLIYRLAEALLTPISRLFLIDSVDAGGLGLTTGQVGFVQGTIGVGGLLLGGILGGIAIAAKGFNRWKWWMAAAITPAQHRLPLLGLFPDTESILGVKLRIHRAIRLWIWLHRLHDLFALLLTRQIARQPLRILHRIYGSQHDAPRHGSRLFAGHDGISQFLYSGHGNLPPHVPCHVSCQSPLRLREKLERNRPLSAKNINLSAGHPHPPGFIHLKKTKHSFGRLPSNAYFCSSKVFAKEATGFTKEHILVINACKIAITKLAPTIIGHTDNCLFFSNIKS